MSKAKHTPGPWFFHRDELLHERHPHGSYTLVGKFEQDDTGNEWDVDEANARLIAAAPELLEACEKWVELIERTALENKLFMKLYANSQVDFMQGLDETRAAIAKAEGRD